MNISRVTRGMSVTMVLVTVFGTGSAGAVEFDVTLHVKNLKGQRLVEGQADDDPRKVLTAADLVLFGSAYLGQRSVDGRRNAVTIISQPTLDPADNRRTSTYVLRLSVPDESQVARLVVKLQGRQAVDLQRIAALTQTITVSMPEEKNMAPPCWVRCRCVRRHHRCRR